MKSAHLKIIIPLLAISLLGVGLRSTNVLAMTSTATSEVAPTRLVLSGIAFGEDRHGFQIDIVMGSGRFRWVRASESGRHVAGEGYALLFIDGKEIGRLTSPAFALVDEPGRAPVDARVRLMRNDHEPYRTASGDLIEASMTLRN